MPFTFVFFPSRKVVNSRVEEDALSSVAQFSESDFSRAVCRCRFLLLEILSHCCNILLFSAHKGGVIILNIAFASNVLVILASTWYKIT